METGFVGSPVDGMLALWKCACLLFSEERTGF